MDLLDNKILADTLLFKGAGDNPFLAPRGIWTVDGKLFVSDTGQNRVFIWWTLPYAEFVAPDIVLGQIEETHTARNAGDMVSAGSLQYPSGIWSDGKKLIVADAWNHRVMIWHQLPNHHGHPADVVIGQPSFNTNLPNVKGIGALPDARTLNWPYGVHSDGSQLWVADTGNRRVLYFAKIPETSFSPADKVIGQSGFQERDYNPENPIWPYSVRVGPKGQLAVTDTQYFRVLLWNNLQDAFDKPADCIIGQQNFLANGQNQFQLHPSSRALNWCYDSFFHKDGIWVVDTGNSRLLWFDPVPDTNNTSAADLIGHDNFSTGSENQRTVNGTEHTLYWPFSISLNDRVMAIADTGNHRILLKNNIDK